MGAKNEVVPADDVKIKFTEDYSKLKDKSACARLRAQLKMCLLESECCTKLKKTPKECLRERNPDIVPQECFALHYSFFECKRSIIDNRQRFRGRKGD